MLAYWHWNNFFFLFSLTTSFSLSFVLDRRQRRRNVKFTKVTTLLMFKTDVWKAKVSVLLFRHTTSQNFYETKLIGRLMMMRKERQNFPNAQKNYEIQSDFHFSPWFIKWLNQIKSCLGIRSDFFFNVVCFKKKVIFPRILRQQRKLYVKFNPNFNAMFLSPLKWNSC